MTDEQQHPWQDASPQHDDAKPAAQDATAPTNAADGATTPTTQIPTPPSTAPRHADAQPTTTIPAASKAYVNDGTTAPAFDTSEDSAESTNGTYRPAPHYGAYGPVPDSVREQQREEEHQSAYPQAQQNDDQQQPTQPMGLFGLPFQDQNQNVPQNNGQNNGQYRYGPNQQQNPQQYPYGQPAQGAQPGQPQHGGNGQGNGGQPPQQPGSPYGQPGQPAPQQPRTASNVVVAVIAALVAAALCLGLGYAAITSGWVKVPTTGSVSSLSNGGGSGSAALGTDEVPNWVAVNKKVGNGVVAITVETSDGEAKGSGAILDKDGHIITNNHVISGAKSIQVNLENGDIYEADLVGSDATTDLAVIKLKNPPSDLTTIEFADSDDLAVGEAVMAIGNPLGYDGSVTTGIISALNRPVTVMDEDNTAIVTNAIQLDAAINPGNSGGPTFNAAGQVIGINSSIASTATSSETAGSIGIGFAIPSNLVKRVAEEIIKDGKVQHVALGVTIKSGTVTADGVTRGAAIVQSVVSGGPAAKAGIKAGDAIVGFNGLSVSNNYSLLGFVRAAAMGSTAKLTIVRDGKTIEVDVTFDQAESAVNGSNRSDSGSSSGNSGNSNGDSGTEGDSGSNSQRQQEQQNGSNGLTDPFGWW